MKKKVIFGLLMAMVFCEMPAIAMDGRVWSSSQEGTTVAADTNNLPSDAKSKTVYLIVGNNAVVPKNAYYSPSEERIYVKVGKHMMNYNVHENPFYGQDSAKGKYKYKAGDYFFDI